MVKDEMFTFAPCEHCMCAFGEQNKGLSFLDTKADNVAFEKLSRTFLKTFYWWL